MAIGGGCFMVTAIVGNCMHDHDGRGLDFGCRRSGGGLSCGRQEIQWLLISQSHPMIKDCRCTVHIVLFFL